MTEAINPTGWNATHVERPCRICGEPAYEIFNVCYSHLKKRRGWKAQHTSDGKRGGPHHKLDEEQCAEIRKLDRTFHSQVDIARRFGVSRDTVRKILKGTYR